MGIERMHRMYIAQQCFGLTDEGAEDALYDSQAIRNQSHSLLHGKETMALGDAGFCFHYLKTSEFLIHRFRPPPCASGLYEVLQGRL